VLEEVRLHGLGVIADAVLELGPGLTVLTGETGAGKTMVVQGLALLCGGRLDSGLVGAAGRAMVEGRWLLPDRSPAGERAAEAGAELDEGALIVVRTMTADGRSRCSAGGRSVPVGLLGELAESLVARHGQHDQQRLTRSGEQRSLLDRFAGTAVAEPLARYRDRLARLRTAEAELADITQRRRERAQEADLLRLGLSEIAAVSPVPGEDAALATELARLGAAEQLRAAAGAAHEALAGDPGGETTDATTLVAAARSALSAVEGTDPELDGLARRVAEASYLLADVAADLSAYAAGVEADPERLAMAQDRRAALTALLRKYGDDLAEVVEWAEQASARLLLLDSDDERLTTLGAERSALRAELADLAQAVSSARAEAGARLAARTTDELRALAMPDATVAVELSHQSDPDGLVVEGRQVAFGPDGIDTVDLTLVPHPGAPPRPLGRGASGGELSRVMLALEVVLAAADPVPTMVFDEVDAGVGGKAAVEIGRRLARLARTHQVLVVTHLPQVAAFADRHLLVEKDASGSVTTSGVTRLDDEGRLRELSRMLAGLEDTAHARGHAEELLAAASTAKAAP
jgi:DNA repair protein RecN (Recombination protein N)